MHTFYKFLPIILAFAFGFLLSQIPTADAIDISITDFSDSDIALSSNTNPSSLDPSPLGHRCEGQPLKFICAK